VKLDQIRVVEYRLGRSQIGLGSFSVEYELGCSLLKIDRVDDRLG